MRGLTSLQESEKSALISEFERDRLSRIERYRENLVAKREADLIRSKASDEARANEEAQLRAQIELSRQLREKKQKEWLIKTKANDAIRAREKEEMRKLAELNSTKTPSASCIPIRKSLLQAKAKSLSSARVLSTTHSDMNDIKPRFATPLASTRSALAEYVKFSHAVRKHLDEDRARYRQKMDGTSYAHNVKLASTVYSRKL